MPKELLILDVDDTLIFGQSQMLFIQYAYKKGFVATLGYTRLALGFLLYKLHIIQNPKSVMELGLSFFKGKPITEVDLLIKGFFNEVLVDRFNKKILDIVEKNKINNTDTILVSNAIYPIVRVIADYLQIKDILCTQVDSSSALFSGTIEGELMYGVNKLTAVKQYIEKKGIKYEKIWAYADHRSDIPLLEWSTNPVAINPDKVLLEKAKLAGWQIITQ